ncbi:hypothetical protein ABZ512_21095 [Nocardiopsis dassonvillei]|uniref:hypothetical protein n=1 Tax=Nocardiopsis dassonvillei TaxID=2014 RepID=UPI0033FA6CBC
MATAAVGTVPHAWVEQTRSGGIVVVPFGTAFHSGALLRLKVDRGVAAGRFDGDAAFMWTRAQRPRTAPSRTGYGPNTTSVKRVRGCTPMSPWVTSTPASRSACVFRG